jgi:hypothetical protein
MPARNFTLDTAPPTRSVDELWERSRLQELLHSLNWLGDDGQLDELLNQFVDDLRYEIEGMAVFTNKETLRQFFVDVVGAFGMRIHRTSNQIIEVRSETASSRSYWRADLELKGRSVVSAGRYFDDFVLRDGVWKVASRKATLTYISPLDEGWGRTRYLSLA